MEFERVVTRRRMVRNYSDEPVAPDQLERVLALARKTPSAGFSQGQSLVVIADPAVKARLVAAYGIDDDESLRMYTAPVLIVVCTSEKVYRDRYHEPDKRLPDGTPLGAVEWPVPYWYVDAGATMMLLLLAAVDEGLAACYFGVGDWRPCKEVLGIPDHVTPTGFVSLGHPAPDVPSQSLERGWKPEPEVIHRNHW